MLSHKKFDLVLFSLNLSAPVNELIGRELISMNVFNSLSTVLHRSKIRLDRAPHGFFSIS